MIYAIVVTVDTNQKTRQFTALTRSFPHTPQFVNKIGTSAFSM